MNEQRAIPLSRRNRVPPICGYLSLLRDQALSRFFSCIWLGEWPSKSSFACPSIDRFAIDHPSVNFFKSQQENLPIEPSFQTPKPLYAFGKFQRSKTRIRTAKHQTKRQWVDDHCGLAMLRALSDTQIVSGLHHDSATCFRKPVENGISSKDSLVQQIPRVIRSSSLLIDNAFLIQRTEMYFAEVRGGVVGSRRQRFILA